jgi:hypothetical protein
MDYAPKTDSSKLATLDRKIITYYFGLVIKVYLQHWFVLSEEDIPIDFPKAQLIQRRKENKTIAKQSRKPSPKVVTKEQFISQQRSIRLANISP